MRWFISDTHFGHTKIIEYEDRPFCSVGDMDRSLIQNWNKVVKADDLVYHLGDFSFHPEEKTREIVQQLNGTKVLIQGNHDRSLGWFSKVGLPVVVQSGMIKIDRYLVNLIHNPDEAPDCGWTLHGHVHGKWAVKSESKLINVSVEVIGYTPISETQIATLIKQNSKASSFSGS